ncbi:MAG: ABC transporter permease [Thermoanaerobaculia bacterium]|nr:ABC transporter permease [Thermoanaerobaculia bacterium]
MTSRESRNLSVRLYQWLVSFLPDDFDADLRRDTIETFVDIRRAARRRGRFASLRVTVGSLWHGAGAVLAERREANHALRATSSISAEVCTVEHHPRRNTTPGDLMDSLRHDLQTALRAFRHRPGFALASVVIMALGIAAATTLFSVVDDVLLQPLPYPDSERIVYFDEGSHPIPLFEIWHDDMASVEDLAAAFTRYQVLTGEQEPARIQTARLRGDFFELFGAKPAKGRLLQAQDFDERARVAVISHRLWRTRWGSDEGLLGQTISVDGEDFTVVGVMAPDFQMPEAVDEEIEIWMPLDPGPEMAHSWNYYVLEVVGRLAEGVTLSAAQDEVRAIDLRVAEEHPEERNDREGNPQLTPLVGLHEATVFGSTERLWVLLGAGFAVLLVGCANVAGLSLARGQERLRDLAVREALGAGKLRLARQLLIESVLLSLAGGAAGIALAQAGVKGFLALQPGDLPRLHEVSLDPRVLTLALLATVACGLLCGTAPALQAARSDLERVLRSDTSGTAGRDRRSGRPLFVIFEVALSLMLLTGAGLLAHSLLLQYRQPAGIDTERLVRIPLQLPENTIGGAEEDLAGRIAQRTNRLIESLEALPEVDSAAVTWAAPFTYFGRGRCCWRTVFAAEPDTDDKPRSMVHPVTAGFLGTLGADLLVGRDLDERDGELEPPPLIVNRHMAGELLSEFGLPGSAEDAQALASLLGRQVLRGSDEEAMQIVGVVDHIYEWGPTEETEPVSYVSYERFGGEIGLASVVVRIRTNLQANLVERLRQAIWQVDPRIPVPVVESMDERRRDAFAEPRFYSVILALFAGVSLLLAAAGLYATLHYTVTRRRCEMGIRMALGARHREVVRLVLRQGFGWLVAGLALGWVFTAISARVLQSQLFGVGVTDPWTVGTVSLVLLLSGLAACWIPARSAARVDPVKTLRAD